MCGVVGWFTSKVTSDAAFDAALQAMSERLHHRGPDDRGQWRDAAAGIGLAHTRLAILDLTVAGHQPMQSACGRYVLSFNGEIYNHEALRAALRASQTVLDFRGHSDTETLLAAITTWGLEQALSKAHGMFALALWDRGERRLSLARDRLGEKPLYYAQLGQQLLFGSELKALMSHPAWDGLIDRAALGLYLLHGYIPAPHTIFKQTRKVLPGEILVFSRTEAGVSEVARKRYWQHQVAPDAALSEAPALDRLETLLCSSIRRQMLADVPVGAFLSGGIDSSLIVALMQREAPGAVQTFTIGVDDPRYDEAQYARQVADHLGTRHETLYVTAEDALALIPTLPDHYDEPFADASAIPTLLVARLARGAVTVSLSGDGGDELFGGYNHYRWGARLCQAYQFMPYGLRQAMSALLARTGAIRPSSSMSARLIRLSELISEPDCLGLLLRISSHWREPERLLQQYQQAACSPRQQVSAWSDLSFVEQLMLYDKQFFLPDDIMTKVDRASMAVSLESRAPFLDHAVAEFAASVPVHLKIQQGRGKWLLRRLLARYLPEALIERPKMGFGVPIAAWLHGPLRDWAQTLLDPHSLAEQGFLNPAYVSKMWGAHLQGRQQRGAALWNLLMFQAWLERYQSSWRA